MIEQEILDRLKKAGVVQDKFVPLQFIPTGNFAFNRVLSGKYSGGYPVGAITEIFGESSTGKTAFLTAALIQAQRKGYHIALLDNEFAFQPELSKEQGLDLDKLIYTTPDSLEQAFDYADKIIKAIRESDKDTPILIGLDSIGTATSVAELEEEMTDQNNMAGAIRAKVVGRLLRKINPTLKKNKVAFIIINQVRSKVGVMYGDPTTKAGGGKSLDFYCHTSNKIKSNKTSNILEVEGKKIGIEGVISNTKNKVSDPFQECEFTIYWDKGVDPYSGLVSWLVKDGVLERNGAWYAVSCNGKKFQSKDFVTLLNDESVKEFDVIREKLK